MISMPTTYETLTAEDLLNIARDALRGRESDHYRLSLLSPASSGGPTRLKEIEAEIASIKGEIRAMEAKAAGK
jgi:hypothetical protein